VGQRRRDCRQPRAFRSVGLLSPVRSVPDRLMALTRSYLFEDLTQEELQPLAASATNRMLVRGEFLTHLGDPAEEIWVVVVGEVKGSVVDTSGFEVIHAIHGPGMTLGEPGFFSVVRNRLMDIRADHCRPSRSPLPDFVHGTTHFRQGSSPGVPGLRLAVADDQDLVDGAAAAHRSAHSEAA